jgi:hypothetical protein
MQTQASFNKDCFRLLELPGELRNRVYELALSSENGIVYNHGVLHTFPKNATKNLIADPQHPALNQLQYVNRQLREETRFLELRYNTVIFVTDEKNKLKAVDNLVRFQKNIPHQKLEMIRSIHLYPSLTGREIYMRDAEQEAHALIDAMRQVKELKPYFPNAEVGYTFPMLRAYSLHHKDGFHTALFFVIMAEIVAMLLYGQVLSEYDDPDMRYHASRTRRIREEHQVQKLVEELPKFRVWPVTDKKDKWGNFMRSNNGNVRDLFPDVDDESSKEKARFWLDLYEDWQRHGVSIPGV